MNLLSELYTRVSQTTESWQDIQSIHLTVTIATGGERVYICPSVPENMGGLLERFLEHISRQEDIVGISAGCVWFKSGNILKFEPNEMIEIILGGSGYWEFIKLPPNPKDIDVLDKPGMEWLSVEYLTRPKNIN